MHVQLGLTSVASATCIGGSTTLYLLEQLCRLDAVTGGQLRPCIRARSPLIAAPCC